MPGADKPAPELGMMLASVTALHGADTRPVNPHSSYQQRTSMGRMQATTSLDPAQPAVDDSDMVAGELYHLVSGQSSPGVTGWQMVYRMNRTSGPHSHHPRHRHIDGHCSV
jgi:hypothetical protein